MAASTLISNIPPERSSLKKTDNKQKVKDYATVQVSIVKHVTFSDAVQYLVIDQGRPISHQNLFRLAHVK